MRYDIVIIGAGPAGMAAAVSAKKSGAENILLVERDEALGGVLMQCIHDGFGIYEFSSSLTGPEYAARYKKMVDDEKINYLTDSMVTSVEKLGDYFEISLSSLQMGFIKIKAKSVIVATGCREMTSGQMKIPGSRPAGVMTAGLCQNMINRKNFIPGKSAVILGTGDIGLIMARRLTLEGVKVRMIVGQYPTGLMRNYLQCVKDFDIPLKLGYTVSKISGKKRLTGVTVNKMDEEGNVSEKGEYIRCDTLIIATKLIPETDVIKNIKEEGIFFCGNAIRPFDLVDQVSISGKNAGIMAASYVKGEKTEIKKDEFSFVSGRKMTKEDIDFAKKGGVFCILCPRGCKIKKDGNRFLGFGCEKGLKYAKQETEFPKRTVTTVVKHESGKLIPVKTKDKIDISNIMEVIKLCKKIKVKSDVNVGDIIAKDVFGTDILSTGEYK